MRHIDNSTISCPEPTLSTLTIPYPIQGEKIPEEMGIISEIVTYTSTQAKETAREIVKAAEGTVTTPNGYEVTIFDLMYTPNDVEYKSYKKLALKTLGIEEFDKKVLQELSNCFIQAKEFLQNYLGIGLKSKLKDKQDFSSEKDIIDFLKNTGISKDKSHPITAVFYCTLAKITLAFWEFNQEQLNGLNNEGEFLFNRLRKDHEGFKRIRENGIITKNSRWIPLEGKKFRGKSKESCILKLLNKPKKKWIDVMKDGIGFELEVKTKEDAVDCLAFLAIHLQELGAKNLNVENVKFFEGDYAEIVQSDMQENNIGYDETSNDCSGNDFQTAKIIGETVVPFNGDPKNDPILRTFEIQINLVNNKNNEGLNDHRIFKALSKISVVCRLFRTVSEDYIDMIAEEVSEQTGICTRKIKQERFLKILERIYSKNYTHPKHKRRWSDGGLVPPDFGIQKTNLPELADAS
ncbi:hypothetical protein GF354_04650 [Candidatus Peregrinibacteria bacterium]|nr:hypothetical protein [Candidatus Peregrinibacteria bacterium]